MPERSTQKMLFQDTSLSFNRETGFTDVSTASADLNTRTADHRLPVLLIVNGGYPASAGFSHWYRNSSITAATSTFGRMGGIRALPYWRLHIGYSPLMASGKSGGRVEGHLRG